MIHICCETERSYLLKYSASLFPGSVIALLKFHQVATWAGLPRPFSLHTWYLSLLSQGWGWRQTNYIESGIVYARVRFALHLTKNLQKISTKIQKYCRATESKQENCMLWSLLEKCKCSFGGKYIMREKSKIHILPALLNWNM